MRFVFITLLFLKVTFVLAQNNDSSVIVKGHLRAILQKAQEEDKMILLFPTKRFTIRINEYPNKEVYVSEKGVASVSRQNDIFDIDAWLLTLKSVFPTQYIIAPVDISYGEGKLLMNELSQKLYLNQEKYFIQESIKKNIYILNERGDLIEYSNFYDGDLLRWTFKNTKPNKEALKSLAIFWKELPDFNYVIANRTQLWNAYRENKEDKDLIQKLYKHNLHLGVQDCEIKDKYFLMRQSETLTGYFDDEEEFLMYSCKENSRARDFFLKYGVARSKYPFIWLDLAYNEAVRTKNDTLFKEYLEAKDANSCHCYCYQSEFDAVRYANEIKDYDRLKVSAQRFMKTDFFNLKSTCWKKIGKSKSKDRIAYLTDEIVKFYYQNFKTNEELQTALFWVNSALDVNSTEELLYSKSKILFRLGRIEEAKQIAKANAKNPNLRDIDRKSSVDFRIALSEIEDGTF